MKLLIFYILIFYGFPIDLARNFVTEIRTKSSNIKHRKLNHLSKINIDLNKASRKTGDYEDFTDYNNMDSIKQSLTKDNSTYDDISMKPKIQGGWETTPEQIRFLVSLQLKRTHKNYFGSGHFCGGSVLSTKKILTAAHCITKPSSAALLDPDSIIVLIGIHYLFRKAGSSLERTIESIKKHPDYDPMYILNDIAILFLREHIPNDRVPRMIVPLNTHAPGEAICNAYGWGRLFDNGPIPARALTVNLSLRSHKYCRHHFGSYYGKGMICAAPTNAYYPQSTCSGDSGGPLICRRLITGITSFGSDCGEPVVYTDVQYFTKWLDNLSGKLYPSKFLIFIVTLNELLQL